jgi:hypothetical protein
MDTDHAFNVYTPKTSKPERYTDVAFIDRNKRVPLNCRLGNISHPCVLVVEYHTVTVKSA